jgi:MFS family permease
MARQTAVVPFAGALADRLGPRQIMLPAAALYAGGWAFAAGATSLGRLSGPAPGG